MVRNWWGQTRNSNMSLFGTCGTQVGVGGGQAQRSDWRGGLHSLLTLLVVLCAGHVRRALFLLPASQKWQVGFWSFCIFLLIICPNIAACMQLFLVPYSFFVLCCLKRRWSRCKHCRVLGPTSQLVSVSFPRSLSPYLMTSWATNKLWIILVLMTNLKKKN